MKWLLASILISLTIGSIWSCKPRNNRASTLSEDTDIKVTKRWIQRLKRNLQAAGQSSEQLLTSMGELLKIDLNFDQDTDDVALTKQRIDRVTELLALSSTLFSHLQSGLKQLRNKLARPEVRNPNAKVVTIARPEFKYQVDQLNELEQGPVKELEDFYHHSNDLTFGEVMLVDFGKSMRNIRQINKTLEEIIKTLNQWLNLRATVQVVEEVEVIDNHAVNLCVGGRTQSTFYTIKWQKSTGSFGNRLFKVACGHDAAIIRHPTVRKINKIEFFAHKAKRRGSRVTARVELDGKVIESQIELKRQGRGSIYTVDLKGARGQEIHIIAEGGPLWIAYINSYGVEQSQMASVPIPRPTSGIKCYLKTDGKTLTFLAKKGPTQELEIQSNSECDSKTNTQCKNQLFLYLSKLKSSIRDNNCNMGDPLHAWIEHEIIEEQTEQGIIPGTLIVTEGRTKYYIMIGNPDGEKLIYETKTTSYSKFQTVNNLRRCNRHFRGNRAGQQANCIARKVIETYGESDADGGIENSYKILKNHVLGRNILTFIN